MGQTGNGLARSVSRVSLIAAEAIYAWNHKGVTCVIRPVRVCINGYVQLPVTLRPWWDQRELDAYGDPTGIVRVHGDVTYGIDHDGWIGFDTGHSGDIWPPDELAGHLAAKHMEAAHLYREYIQRFTRDLDREMIVWSVDKLRAEVNRLADQIADLTKEHGHVPEAGSGA